jgi:NADH:ubiquinone oxidoreductase subunit E
LPDTEATLEIKHLIADLKPGEGDLLAALHRLQEQYGYIPPIAIPVVAQHLKLGTARVYGTISFYSEFRLTPPPETTVSWCSGPACCLKGSENIRLILEAVLGIKMGESTEDPASAGLGLHPAQCNGTCDLAPLVWINGRPRGRLSAADAVRLARELSRKANPPSARKDGGSPS